MTAQTALAREFAEALPCFLQIVRVVLQPCPCSRGPARQVRVVARSVRPRTILRPRPEICVASTEYVCTEYRVWSIAVSCQGTQPRAISLGDLRRQRCNMSRFSDVCLESQSNRSARAEISSRCFRVPWPDFQISSCLIACSLVLAIRPRLRTSYVLRASDSFGISRTRTFAAASPCGQALPSGSLSPAETELSVLTAPAPMAVDWDPLVHVALSVQWIRAVGPLQVHIQVNFRVPQNVVESDVSLSPSKLSTVGGGDVVELQTTQTRAPGKRWKLTLYTPTALLSDS